MFENPGEKIKRIAEFTFGIDIMLSIVGMIYILCNFNGFLRVLIAILTLFVSVFVSWAKALILFGFGHLISEAEETNKINRDILHRIQHTPKTKNHEVNFGTNIELTDFMNKNPDYWMCSCGEITNISPCPNCGR